MRAVFGMACVLAACHGSSSVPEARADSTPVSQGVLVELFTSEGCSSCPPADALLADLAADPHVFALSFHVDYWDQLGWPDRFASSENTARQKAYAMAFGARGLYTPELVVGGTQGFVGSDRAEAQSAIATALRRPAPVPVTVSPRRIDPATLEVSYSSPGAPPGAVMNVAVVAREATTQVRAGENAGRTLHHVNVVRAFASAAASTSGILRIALPPGQAQDAEVGRTPEGVGRGQEVIAFVQSADGAEKGKPVLGMARASVP
jgi:hypothetical protein